MPKRKRNTKRGNGEGTVFQRSDGRWQGAVTIGTDEEGKQRKRTVYGRTQEEAKSNVLELRQQLANGTYISEKVSVKTLFERWIKEKARQVKRRTLAQYRYNVDKHIVPNLGTMNLEKLTPLKVQTLLSDIADKNGTDRANKVRTVLYQACKQAVVWLLLPRSPVEATERFKHTKQEMKLWTPQDAAQFLDKARSHRQYALFYLAISSGLCVGELLGLEWTDLQGDAIHVQRSIGWVEGELEVTTPKTEKGRRRVKLDKVTLGVLEQHRTQQEVERHKAGERYHAQGILFANRHGAYTKPRKLSQHWYELQALSGVPKIRFHDLRHLNVSLRRKLGQDAKLIADQVGHADPAFTIRQYTHLFQDDLENAAVNLTEWLPKGSDNPN